MKERIRVSSERRIRALCMAAVMAVVGGLARADEAAQVSVVESAAPVETAVPATISVSVVPGPSFFHRMFIAVIPVNKAPQFACWLESADGIYLSTISVTKSGGENSWVGSPKDGRPEALPVWSHARSLADSDAQSSATPKGSVSLERAGEGLVVGKEYAILLEINASFDYNDAWPKKAKEGDPRYSGVNGQPSLVYRARFTAGSGEQVTLEPIGQGAPDGSSGTITMGLEGLTTALTMIEKPIATITMIK